MEQTKLNLADKFTGFPDLEIISRIIKGEKELYEILIRRNNPYLYKTGRSYGYNHEDTEDLMQETYLSAYVHLSDFKNLSEFKTWITRIMINQCYQRSQKSSFKNEIPTNNISEYKKTSVFNNNIQDSEKMMINKELGNLIEKALLQIPLDYRVVFSLRELNGLSVKATADALNITEVNVKVRLNRAKTMLKKELENMYTPAEIFEFNLVYCDRIVERVMSRIS